MDPPRGVPALPSQEQGTEPTRRGGLLAAPRGGLRGSPLGRKPAAALRVQQGLHGKHGSRAGLGPGSASSRGRGKSRSLPTCKNHIFPTKPFILENIQ